MILRLLLPSFAVVAKEARGPLTAWLARGDRIESTAPGRAAALSRTFDLLPKQPLAAAAITRDALCGDAGDATWVRADPGHARADMANLRLMRCGDLAVTPDEIAALLPSMRPLFGDDGFEFTAPDPDRWFLRGLTSADVPDTEDPADILGNDLHAHMPSQRKWLKLLNEAQVILHHHPVNEARTARGQLPVNTIWFWGAGKRPTRVGSSFARFVATDELLMAYGSAAKMERAAIASLADATQNTVVEAWTRPNWNALLQHLDGIGRFDEIELDCWTGERFRWRRPHRFRFWRKLLNPVATATAR